MNLFGMGTFELLVVLAIALVVLGPGKTIGMARNAGRIFGEVRRAFSDLSKMAEEEERHSAQAPRSGGRPGAEDGPASEAAKDTEAEEKR